MNKIASDEQVKHWAKQLMPNGKATYGELERKNAELERKLAEQQAITKPLNIFYIIEVERTGWFKGRESGQLVFTQHAEEAITFYDSHSAEVIMREYFKFGYMHPTTYGKAFVSEHAWCNGPDASEELNNLLAKAKEEGRKEAVPEGWQVVPKEPTLEMLSVMNESGWIKGNYKAMLAAAPKPQGE